MKQASPEGNFSSREDTLLKNTVIPTTSDVIILGEDFRQEAVDAASIYNPDFIGPRDATNEARPLLENQAKNLALVAVMNIAMYGREYTRVADAARRSVAAGMLRLNGDFPNLTVDQQVDEFISKNMIGAYKSHDEVVADLKVEREQQRLGSKGPDKELQLELNAAKELLVKQAHNILAVRTMLIEGGASEEFMRKFSYTTKLMTKPEQEAYELEKQLTPETELTPLVNTEELRLFDRFRHVISSLSREGIKRVGIRAPQSGEVAIVNQDQKVVSR